MQRISMGVPRIERARVNSVLWQCGQRWLLVPTIVVGADWTACGVAGILVGNLSDGRGGGGVDALRGEGGGGRGVTLFSALAVELSAEAAAVMPSSPDPDWLARVRRIARRGTSAKRRAIATRGTGGCW